MGILKNLFSGGPKSAPAGTGKGKSAPLPPGIHKRQLSQQGTYSMRAPSPQSQGVTPAAPGFTTGGTRPDPALTQRIKRAYRLAIQAHPGSGTSMWAGIVQRNASVHEALLADDDSLDAILSDPGKSDLFFGFHSLFASQTEQLRAASVEDLQSKADALTAEFLLLCQALGLRRIRNPETGKAGKKEAAQADIESILRQLDALFGIPVTFPNPYPNEFGIVTSRGIASYRPIHALYQAFRLHQLSAVCGPRILEIGAGMGRTVGYAYSLGLRDCTIIDLPMSNVAQASFLGQTLGPDALTLYGEERRPGTIHIHPPEWLPASGEKFDIVLNVDSMTEMDRKYAEGYAAFIQGAAKCFLSINHDANAFRVCDLEPLKKMFSQRFPYWMRDGYTEEIYVQHGA